MLTFPVKGHLWSTKSESMAVWGVLKPIPNRSVNLATPKLTEANFFVESNTSGCLLCLQFFGVEEYANLLLEGFFVLQT
jgi:hypothetical protein